MGKTTTIICDGCGDDITRTTNCEGYLLCLDNRSMPTVSGIVTSMGAYPVLDRDYYVCSQKCLLAVVEPWRLQREAELKRDSSTIKCAGCGADVPRKKMGKSYSCGPTKSETWTVVCRCPECGHSFSFDEFTDPLKLQATQ